MVHHGTIRQKRHTRRGFTHKHIKTIYGKMDGYGVNLEGYNPKYPTVYGEITVDGLKLLKNAFHDIHPILTYPASQRTFYDLGSGIGKNVIMMASLVPEIMSKGIELVKDRHAMAITAYQKITDKSISSRIHLECGSFTDASLLDAAWIFVSNLCFSPELNKLLSNKLAKDVYRNTLIACSSELQHPSFQLLKQVKIPMTWDENSIVYIYTKK